MVAAVTLGKDMTFRDYAQGAFRMRGIGKGQKVQVSYAASHELLFTSHDARLILGWRSLPGRLPRQEPAACEQSRTTTLTLMFMRMQRILLSNTKLCR